MGGRAALAVGIGLSARGSTELVVARIGMDLGVLAAPMYAVIILVPIVTSLLTPVLLRAVVGGLRPAGAEARRLADESSERRAIIPRRGTKILVPLSGERHALLALQLAAPLARLPGATVVGLSIRTRKRGRHGPGTDGPSAEEAAVTASEETARRLSLPDFHASLVDAASVDEAVTAEVARGYDLVFLGLRRPRTLSHRLVRALLASGESDLVIVRALARTRRFRRILLPMTGAAPSRAAVELGLLHARELGAQLRLLHVVEPGAFPDRRAFTERRLIGARMMEEVVARGRREGLDVRCRLVASRFPARAILDAAVDERADLVLLGATPRYVGPRAYFGPTTDFLLGHPPCAVAVYAGAVRPEALRAATPDAGALAPGADGAAAEAAAGN
jgi:nucleotide-binding universal stress UspA family protein